jgi:DNA-binding response OmpR family regulator
MLGTEAPTLAERDQFEIDLRHTGPPALRPRRILVVDDEPSMRSYLGDLLRGEGYHVDAVPSCMDGLIQLLRTQYDFLVLDLILPEVNGVFLYNQAARLNRKLASRTIFITGGGPDDPLVRQAGELDVPVLWKPFPPWRLVEMLGCSC